MVLKPAPKQENLTRQGKAASPSPTHYNNLLTFDTEKPTPVSKRVLVKALLRLRMTVIIKYFLDFGSCDRVSSATMSINEDTDCGMDICDSPSSMNHKEVLIQSSPCQIMTRQKASS